MSLLGAGLDSLIGKVADRFLDKRQSLRMKKDRLEKELDEVQKKYGSNPPPAVRTKYTDLLARLWSIEKELETK